MTVLPAVVDADVYALMPLTALPASDISSMSLSCPGSASSSASARANCTRSSWSSCQLRVILLVAVCMAQRCLGCDNSAQTTTVWQNVLQSGTKCGKECLDAQHCTASLT